MALTEIDRTLLSRCLNREPGAWNDFVDRFISLFAHVTQHVAHSRSVKLQTDDIDDVCAEIFLTVLANDYAVLSHFRGKCSLATYLTVVSRRVAVREVVRRRHAEAMGHVVASKASIDMAHAQSKQSAEVQRVDDRELVTQMLEGLTPQEREVVQRYHLAGKSYREISADMKIPVNTIGPTLTRARSKLREQHAG